MFIHTDGVVSWVSKLQTIVVLSIAKAEYMSIIQACKEAIWITRLMEEHRHRQEKIHVVL